MVDLTKIWLIRQSTMSGIIQRLQQVAAQLNKEGKTPSLALFKARLSGEFPAPQLFTAYQQWKSSLQDNHQPVAETQSQPLPDDTISFPVSLQQQLDRIEAKLDLLLRRIPS